MQFTSKAGTKKNTIVKRVAIIVAIALSGCSSKLINTSEGYIFFKEKPIKVLTPENPTRNISVIKPPTDTVQTNFYRIFGSDEINSKRFISVYDSTFYLCEIDENFKAIDTIISQTYPILQFGFLDEETVVFAVPTNFGNNSPMVSPRFRFFNVFMYNTKTNQKRELLERLYSITDIKCQNGKCYVLFWIPKGSAMEFAFYVYSKTGKPEKRVLSKLGGCTCICEANQGEPGILCGDGYYKFTDGDMPVRIRDNTYGTIDCYESNGNLIKFERIENDSMIYYGIRHD